MPDTLIVVIAVLAVLLIGFLVFRARSKTTLTDASQGLERERDLETIAETAGQPVPATDRPEGPAPAPASAERSPEAPAPPPEPAATPAPAPTSAKPEPAAPPAPAPSPAERDELTRIKGLGPKLVERLHQMGIVRYEQIAGWSAGDIETVAATLQKPNLPARIERDRWVEQADLLARGETAAFEEKFGKMG